MIKDPLLMYHDYKYYPYEKELALAEAEILLKAPIEKLNHGIRLKGLFKENELRRLVYFAKACADNKEVLTLQKALENGYANGGNGGGIKHQYTRYSVHGLHEYKGKFNPQIVRGIVNLMGLDDRAVIFDPFCGSGTTLVECFHAGHPAIGIDINPLAAFIASAKLKALSIDVEEIANSFEIILSEFAKRRKQFVVKETDDLRYLYLKNWFNEGTLLDIELLLALVKKYGGESRDVLLVLISDLLRDYSLQEPGDLRIRRRKSPFPKEALVDRLKKSFESTYNKLKYAKSIIGNNRIKAFAYVDDIRAISNKDNYGIKPPYDAALTSPPYATALPYIDTNRLSLVWLGLCPASDIIKLESLLIGSREARNKTVLRTQMLENSCELPRNIVNLCKKIDGSLSQNDGFRRQAVPWLLYRYFADMKRSFLSVHKLLKKNSPYALVVGRNHTVTNGERMAIDTPELLAELAQQCGWGLKEFRELQTYRRYGIHATNSVSSESLIMLRRH